MIEAELPANELRELVKKLARSLPKKTAIATSYVEIRFNSLGTCGYADESRINLSFSLQDIKDDSQKELVRTFIHEHGHNVGRFLYKSQSFPGNWENHIKNDRFKFVSNTATANFAEDYAETFAAYVISKNSNEGHEELRKKFSSRFEYFDKLFAVQNLSEFDPPLWRRLFRLTNR